MRAALAKAELISEKHGIPFYSYISPLSQGYKPNSFHEKWANLKDIESLLEVDLEYEGWQYSAVC